MKQITIAIMLLLVSINGFSSDFNHDYSQTWVTKMFLSKPDGKGGCEVNLNFQQAMDMIVQTDRMTLGVPKVIYLVGWQYNGHDDKYPAFFEVNERLKRDCDATGLESLRWLIREARKHNTIVSLHINMTDAYDDSPMWDDYVAKDLISKDRNGNLMVIGEYNSRKAYQINYKNEWNSGYTQMRIDRLLNLIPEIQQSGTIHVDAWIARPSEGHNETVVMEAEYQKKAARYWMAKGVDITSEWVMDYMTGYVPYAWHFNGFWQKDYLATPANVYTGTGINPDIKSSDHDLGFLFGTSCYGEPFWKLDGKTDWQALITKDFILKCPQYFFLNSLKRIAVEGEGKNRVAVFSEGVRVSLADSTIVQHGRILRKGNTLILPAIWRDDMGVVIYSADKGGKHIFDVPFTWGDAKTVSVYRIDVQGMKKIKDVEVKNAKLIVDIDINMPYYAIPKLN